MILNWTNFTKLFGCSKKKTKRGHFKFLKFLGLSATENLKCPGLENN